MFIAAHSDTAHEPRPRIEPGLAHPTKRVAYSQIEFRIMLRLKSTRCRLGQWAEHEWAGGRRHIPLRYLRRCSLDHDGKRWRAGA